ncbi:MAG: hypothetical protein E6J01_05510 [Chloroflexi bacterium]|nr:MAG: hypothetical protein E6J01_05510 [Chloroflexota bacterium]
MSRTVCAIDLTSRSVQVLVRRRSGNIEAADFPLPAEALRDGKVLQPPAVQLYLARLMRVLKLRRAEVRLVLSDSACVTRFLAYPRMPPRELERSLRLESARELPMNPASAYLGWETVEADGGQHRVFLVGAWRDIVDGYLEAVEGLGRPKIVEPRSVALARAVGLPDAVLVDWTGERVQAVVVEGYRVTFSTSRTIPSSIADSTARLASFIAGLIPKPSGRRGLLPGRLVLLGELYGRADLAAELIRASGQPFQAILDWLPADPFGRFAASSQAAAIGALMRDQRGAQVAGSFPGVNLLIERNRIMRPQPAVRGRFVIALVVAALMLAVVVGIQIGTLAGAK